jgi:glyoxylase-like metal-dependent hydrolase (beta-lactamase superfamily II)
MSRTVLLLVTLTVASAVSAEVPNWDARGVGALPRQGITSIDVSDDGQALAFGTIAASGDPNVVLLDASGKLIKHHVVGQRWIDQVAFVPRSHDVLALCTMPAGKAGDRPEVFRLHGTQVVPEKIKQELAWFFHYGDHSNHATMQLARGRDATLVVAGNQLVWHGLGADPAGVIRYGLNDPDTSLSAAVGADGWVVVGATSHEGSPVANLHVFHKDQKKAVWSRPAFTDIEAASAPERGLYGKPTLPDGRRDELPQRDDKVYAPLATAIQALGASQYRVAAADYQGWQRWVRSSATMKDDNQGLRFMPTRPTVTIYDQAGAVVRRFAADGFARPFWCDMRFAPDGSLLYVWPHHWKSRGLAGQPILPADEEANTLYVLDVASGKVRPIRFPDAVSDLSVSANGEVVAGCWDGQAYWFKEADLAAARLPRGLPVGGPSLVRFQAGGKQIYVANTRGIVRSIGSSGTRLWETDLNEAVPKGVKPWVAGARATPIVPGVWQIPGGRVESDLGGQRLVEAPEGYILIEAHAGLSFEREWAAIEAVGLDPMKVKYVLATHEHGDHAPGAYLWRVVTGAKFVCSQEMAYTLQHHIPGNTGYGLHPPVPTDVRVKEDTLLDLAGLKVRALRIPGHTNGSMAWHFHKSGKSFVAFGDLIMPRGVLGYSGSVNFSARDILDSLRKLNDLRPDFVLPGHGAIEGPGNYLQAGIDVGTAVGWGFLAPEKPNPRFRITRKNVEVVGWNHQAVSAAFGDVDEDGRPDVVLVAPQGTGSVVKVFLNHEGRFHDRPDHEIRIPQVSQPHKIRCVPSSRGVYLFVAGKTAAVLEPDGKFPSYKIVPFDLPDGNHLRLLEDGKQPRLLVSRRFGAFSVLEESKGRAQLSRFQPDIGGPYADFRLVDLSGTGRLDLVTAYGDVYLRGADGKLPAAPSQKLPVGKKDWTFLAVGDFNGDGKPDVALLSYGMDQGTAARVFYNRGKADRPFADKEDTLIPLSGLLSQVKKGQAPSLIRDTPVVADWNGDGIPDLIVGHGQGDEVLVLLGSKQGLSPQRVVRIALEYRVHHETGMYVGDFNGDGKADLAVFGYTNTGVGSGGPPAVYLWLQ